MKQGGHQGRSGSAGRGRNHLLWPRRRCARESDKFVTPTLVTDRSYGAGHKTWEVEQKRTGGEVKGEKANGGGSQQSCTVSDTVYPALLPLMRTPRQPAAD